MDVMVEALTVWRDGDRTRAVERAAAAGTRLGDELAAHWTGDGSDGVYDQPAAFRAFVRGGGNVELYERLSGALAKSYDEVRPESLLDIGCGDGLAIAPALTTATHTPTRVDLVEPSAALINLAHQRIPGAHRWQETAQEFTARPVERRWDLAQATFSLHTLEHGERLEVLRGLRARTARLTIAEFDVDIVEEGTPEHLASLSERYERGIAEYGEDASLVAQGFLLPVLLGQVVPGAVRSTWEQPAAQWARQLSEAGFDHVDITPLVSYWWSPAVLLTAF